MSLNFTLFWTLCLRLSWNSPHRPLIADLGGGAEPAACIPPELQDAIFPPMVPIVFPQQPPRSPTPPAASASSGGAPSTGGVSMAGNSARRMLNFTIEYRDKNINLVLEDNRTVGESAIANKFHAWCAPDAWFSEPQRRVTTHGGCVCSASCRIWSVCNALVRRKETPENTPVSVTL